jgi:hypothetical protein
VKHGVALALTGAWILGQSMALSSWGGAALAAAFLCAIAGGELGRRRNLADARKCDPAYGGLMRISESPPNT